MTKVLYISYDGMTDPLGRSQVIPYLAGLSRKGYQFHIISCEKRTKEADQENVRALLSGYGITWHPIHYTEQPPVISTLFNILKIKKKAAKIHAQNQFSAVHCRSYIPSLIGLQMKRKSGVKFIFDMRGFWADERVEGGLWNLNNPLYRLIYSYFKKKERQFLACADHTISLTERGKNVIREWKYLSHQPITVIPCCADMERFHPERIRGNKKDLLRKKLNISPDDFILAYLGSIGTWYMLNEMLDLFLTLKKIKSNSKFLFITSENAEPILSAAAGKNIPAENIIIQKAGYEEVPDYLSLSQLAVFFIKPCFSKQGSSPAKLGEMLGMGIPVISNSGIGDIEEFITGHRCGAIVRDFTATGYSQALHQLEGRQGQRMEEIRTIATRYFSLEMGVARYWNVYQELFKNTEQALTLTTKTDNI